MGDEMKLVASGPDFVTVIPGEAPPSPPSPSPSGAFSEIGCAKRTNFDANSIWGAYGRPHPSCNGAPARSDAGSMCVDQSGKPDPTSIFVDMASLTTATGCHAWVTSEREENGCQIDIHRVKSIAFDIDMQNCEDVWAAPLWLCPHPWKRGPHGEAALS